MLLLLLGPLPRSRRCDAAGAARAARPGPQAESSERPLRRRAARMARPARVRMRRRKPWVLARRRLFGWKVRLLTLISVTGGPGWSASAGGRSLRRPQSETRERVTGMRKRPTRPRPRYASVRHRVKPASSTAPGPALPARGHPECRRHASQRQIFVLPGDQFRRSGCSRRRAVVSVPVRRPDCHTHRLWISMWTAQNGLSPNGQTTTSLRGVTSGRC